MRKQVITLLLLINIVLMLSCQDQTAEYQTKGQNYLSQNKWDEAITEFIRVIEIDPNLAMAYYNRSSAYYVKGEYDNAIADFRKVIELNPKDAEAYYNRGRVYWGKRLLK